VSDNYLRLIPADMWFRPDQVAAQGAVRLLQEALPEADQVMAEQYDYPVFIDQGANIESIRCPACSQRRSFSHSDGSEANLEWWQDLIEHLDGENVADAVVTMPCCQSEVPFHRLEFDWPAGVASFELSILNPGIGNPLDPAIIVRVENALGCRVREVWAHY